MMTLCGSFQRVPATPNPGGGSASLFSASVLVSAGPIAASTFTASVGTTVGISIKIRGGSASANSMVPYTSKKSLAVVMVEMIPAAVLCLLAASMTWRAFSADPSVDVPACRALNQESILVFCTARSMLGVNAATVGLGWLLILPCSTVESGKILSHVSVSAKDKPN